MKNISRLLFLFLFAVFSFGLTACSKEKKMENQLERGSGKWDIKKLIYRKNSGWVPSDASEHLDAGSFEFNKDKTIVKTFGFDQTKTVTTGTWVTDEDNITIKWTDGKMSTLHISKTPEKGKMTLYESYTTYYISGYPEAVYEYNYYLERAH